MGCLYLGNQKVAPVVVMPPNTDGVPSYQVSPQGVLSRRYSLLTGDEFDSVTSISSYGLYYNFYNCDSLTGPVNFNNVTTIGDRGMSYSFYGCAGISSVSFNSLTAVGQYGLYYAFSNCTSITSANFSALTTVGARGLQNAFIGCTSLTSVNFPSLTDLTEARELWYAFRDCTSLTILSFPALTSTSFGSDTNQFDYMLSGVTGCTVHFPSNLQSVIGSWSQVTSGFGGTNTTVLFDLPPTT